jgi:hypothetical protein
MNARYLEKLGYGLAATKTDPDVLEAFLREEPKFQKALEAHHQDGNEVLFQTLDRLVKELG